MEYELALKLKNAGFPVEENGNKFYCNGNLCGRNYDDCYEEIVRIPTLSELIEACGEEFGELVRCNDYEIKPMWRAYPTREAFNESDNDCEVDCCGYETGSTPEEAVAKLWLAINKK